jgi:hypothetical protein
MVARPFDCRDSKALRAHDERCGAAVICKGAAMTYAERLKLRRRQLADKRNPAAVALAQIAAAKAREKRAAWVVEHCKRIRETM